MPFVSKAQEQACYAAHDPNWDCAEWQAKTPPKLPKRVRRKGKITGNSISAKKRAKAMRLGRRTPSPQRLDPTRTAALRKRFVNDLKRRFARIKAQIYKLIVEEDAFGLKEFAHDPYALAPTLTNSLEANYRPAGILADNYRPDQLRDEHGRFAYEGGAGLVGRATARAKVGIGKAKKALTKVAKGATKGKAKEHITAIKGKARQLAGKAHEVAKSEVAHAKKVLGKGVAEAMEKGDADHLKSVAKSWAKDRIDAGIAKLPPKVQEIAKAAMAAAVAGTENAAWQHAQGVAEEVAKFRGMSDDWAKRLRGVLGVVDAATGKFLESGGSKLLGEAASKLGLKGAAVEAGTQKVLDALPHIPVATAGYLAFSALRNPLKTAMGAYSYLRKQIGLKGIPKPEAEAKTEAKSPEPTKNQGWNSPLTNSFDSDLRLLADHLAAHRMDEWYCMLVVVSLDMTRDVKKALALATEVYRDEAAPPDALDVVANTRWKFSSDPEKVRAFKDWLGTQVKDNLFSKSDTDLWKWYSEEGFKKGASRAYDDTKQLQKSLAGTNPDKVSFYEGNRDQFLRSAFHQPVAVEKVQLLAGRVYSDLDGVTDQMEAAMTRTLTDGLVQGKSPREIAKDLNGNVDTIGMNRAATIARTEIIRAHAEGQLDALKQLGVDEVGVAVEWTTTPDDKVCPECAPLQGVVLKIDEARGMLPRHPNCRCCFIPANVGEDSTGQKDTSEEIEEAVGESLGADEDDGEMGDALEGGDWGPGEDIDEDRPESVFSENRWVPIANSNPQGCNQFTGPGCGGGPDNVDLHDPASGEVYWIGPRHEGERMLKEQEEVEPGHGLKLRPAVAGVKEAAAAKEAERRAAHDAHVAETLRQESLKTPDGLLPGHKDYVPPPERLYHATFAADAIRAQGFKTSDELGTQVLGGSSSHLVSFAGKADAESYRDALNVARQAARGEMSREGFIQAAMKFGVGKGKAVQIAHEAEARGDHTWFDALKSVSMEGRKFPVFMGGGWSKTVASSSPASLVSIKSDDVKDIRYNPSEREWRVGGLKGIAANSVWVPIATAFVPNAFCPTGKGGGSDNSCSSKGGAGGGSKVPSAKALRAMKAHKMVDKDIQRYAEDHNEPRFAKVVGGISHPDNEPNDVSTDRDLIELKTLVDNSNNKITMDSYAQVRKINAEREEKKVFHTVVSDDSQVKDALGPGSHDDSKRVYYYRRGVAGSARISSLYQCRNEAELKRLMTMSEKDLPPGAQRTDGKLRDGRWKAFMDPDGRKGFRNVKTGREVRAKV